MNIIVTPWFIFRINQGFRLGNLGRWTVVCLAWPARLDVERCMRSLCGGGVDVVQTFGISPPLRKREVKRLELPGKICFVLEA